MVQFLIETAELLSGKLQYSGIGKQLWNWYLVGYSTIRGVTVDLSFGGESGIWGRISACLVGLAFGR